MSKIYKSIDNKPEPVVILAKAETTPPDAWDWSSFIKIPFVMNNIVKSSEEKLIVPFNLVDIYGHKYLFLADENDDITDLTTILTNINFDFTKLQSASDIDIIQKFGQVDLAQYFYVNGKTYIV